MSERAKQRQRAQHATGSLEARHGATFWDGVEHEIEALDVADFALFMRADGLSMEPRPGFARSLSGRLASLVRARWSN
jgi:hypothetical protein